MSEEYRWQAPGNGGLFDSKLENWQENKMSERCVGVLEFLDENPMIAKTDFEMKIAPYLKEKYNHGINESNRGHFYRPLQFIGFIRSIDNKLTLSIDGKNFLKSMHKSDYDSALKFFILQLFKTSYPNEATKDNKLSLFPFRIMFKLLSENSKHHGIIPKKTFFTEIPYITEVNDIYELLKILSDDNYIEELDKITIKSMRNNKKINPEYKFYDKWATWVVSPLIKTGIITEKGKQGHSTLQLSNNIKEFIQSIVDKMHYEDMFFKNENDFEDIKNNIRCKRRNNNIINSVLLKSNFKCFFDENHITFPSSNRPNYVEGHHIIPIALNDSFKDELDCEENVISLCPTCHKAMHYAKNEYKEKLLKIILNKNKEFRKFNMDLEDMKEIYFTKTTQNH